MIGFCNIAARGDKAELLKLYIEPDRIGKGLGKNLLKLGEEFIRSKGLNRYFTLVNKHNKIGVDFYLRNSFKHYPERDEDDEFESKALWYMEKRID